MNLVSTSSNYLPNQTQKSALTDHTNSMVKGYTFKIYFGCPISSFCREGKNSDHLQMRATKTAAYYISPIEIGVF